MKVYVLMWSNTYYSAPSTFVSLESAKQFGKDWLGLDKWEELASGKLWQSEDERGRIFRIHEMNVQGVE